MPACTDDRTAKSEWVRADLNCRPPPCQGGVITSLDHEPACACLRMRPYPRNVIEPFGTTGCRSHIRRSSPGSRRFASMPPRSNHGGSSRCTRDPTVTCVRAPAPPHSIATSRTDDHTSGDIDVWTSDRHAAAGFHRWIAEREPAGGDLTQPTDYPTGAGATGAD